MHWLLDLLDLFVSYALSDREERQNLVGCLVIGAVLAALIAALAYFTGGFKT